MGAVGSLNGVFLFGFTTATLFSFMGSIPRASGRRRRYE